MDNCGYLISTDNPNNFTKVKAHLKQSYLNICENEIERLEKLRVVGINVMELAFIEREITYWQKEKELITNE